MKTSITGAVDGHVMGSPSPSRVLLVALFVMAVAIVAITPGSARVHEDQVDLAPGEAVEVRIDHNSSRDGLVAYWVTVLTGPPVNVWVVHEEGWEQFHDPDAPDFLYYSDASSVNVTEVIEFNLVLDEPGIYHVIIENTHQGVEGDSVNVYYRVHYLVDEDAVFSSPFFWIVIITIVFAVIFLVGFNFMVKRWDASKERDDPAEFMRMMQGDEEPRSRPRPDPGPPPSPPESYSEEVVRGSMEELGHDPDDSWED
jgi:hypothetical protein